MNNTTSDLVTILQYLNSTGGIPLHITSTVATSSSQFWITVGIALMSSVFMLFIIGRIFAGGIGVVIAKIRLVRLKKLTGRNVLMIKHTASSMFEQSMITQKTMIEISKAFDKFKGKPFDLVLHTPGGEIFSSLFISRLLKQYPQNIRVIIPYYAMSGGTLLALSGSEIYMSPVACLGPVDPQLGNLFKYGSAKSWDKIIKWKGKKADDQSISFAYTGQQYTKSIANYISGLLINKMDISKSKKFVNLLTSGDVEHGYPLSINSLNEFGLNVKPLLPEITQRLNKLIASPMFEGVYYA